MADRAFPVGLRAEWTARPNRADFRRALVRATKSAPTLCHNKDLARYANREAKWADWILSVVENKPRGAVRGFALVQLRPPSALEPPTTGKINNSKQTQNGKQTQKQKRRGRPPLPVGFRESSVPRLFLDVICAPGIGAAMLGQVKQKAATMGLGMIELHALPNVIGFYRSQGYVNAGPGSCVEHKDIGVAAARVAKARFATNERAVEDPAFAKFLTVLAHRGTAVDSTCRGVGQEARGCSYNGYIMNRCFQPSAAIRSVVTPRSSAKSSRARSSASTSKANSPHHKQHAALLTSHARTGLKPSSRSAAGARPNLYPALVSHRSTLLPESQPVFFY
jgi:hypothetical protein